MKISKVTKHKAEQGSSSFLSYIPKFFRLLVNLLRDSRVSATDKAIVAATIAYLINPADIVPDWIPFLGTVDDLYLIALALLRLILRTDEKIIAQYWDGPEELVTLLKQVSRWAVAFLPPKVRQALLARVEGNERV